MSNFIKKNDKIHSHDEPLCATLCVKILDQNASEDLLLLLGKCPNFLHLLESKCASRLEYSFVAWAQNRAHSVSFAATFSSVKATFCLHLSDLSLFMLETNSEGRLTCLQPPKWALLRPIHCSVSPRPPPHPMFTIQQPVNRSISQNDLRHLSSCVRTPSSHLISLLPCVSTFACFVRL